ncbi:MAG: hypothetical protein ACJ8BW_02080 [Ktedonobacteraceae bacterium]|jgi:hypothetical protein
MTEAEALKIAMRYMAPGSKLIKSAEYDNFFIFQINGPDPLEGNLDPFFSVDKTTGEFSDFSIAEGGSKLIRKFL